MREKLKYSHTIEKYIEKYGKKNGQKLWSEYCKSRANTLERFIKAYGEKEGSKTYKSYNLNRVVKLQNLNNKGWSKISQELFWNIVGKLKNKYNQIFFATYDESGKRNDNINKEYKVYYDDNKFHRLDFYIKDIDKCIEYDDPKWHNKEKDIEREQNIKKIHPNMKILRVSSIDFKKNKNIIIEKCVKFLEG